ncbi:NAD(P)-dependent alcohol dehydrogenase [Granulosicoccus sp. 3-233]|uniref:NAD(P)-dependent alcohol dehydrogenase n=1 Tax=Granulosicoccus sp. 3-233 TaxID=3417969 RepID=UPI003D338505
MQAVIQTRYGAPQVLQLTSQPKPVPADNEILVRIVASSVTAADSMMRRGTPRYGRLFLGLFKPRHPVSGTGFSGVIEASGSAVSRFRIGEAVMGESVLGAGTHCEYVCVPQDEVICRKPDNLSHAEAATVCDGVVTSSNFLYRLGNVESGQRVLINGAAGSLGSAAVQLAKCAGATVVAVCGRENHDFVRSLGADEVIDYNVSDPLQGDERFDLIYDAVGKLDMRPAMDALREKGRFLSPVLSLPLLIRVLLSRLSGSRQVLFSATGLLPTAERLSLLQGVLPLLEQGRLCISITREYALSEIAQAHEYIDTGHKRGNIVVKP